MLTLAFASGEAPWLGREVNAWLDDGGNVFARAFSAKNLHCIDWPGLAVFAFSAGSHEVKVWPYRGTQPETIADTFSCTLRPIILQALGWQVLHAGATVGPIGVIAFCGRSGSGKSTLAFAMQQVGWQQFADDALVLCLDQDRVMACQLPFKPRLRPLSRAHFTDAHRQFSPAPQRGDAPLAAVFLLQQNADLPRSTPRISRIPPARAFSELLAHAHCFDAEDPTHTRRLVDDYLRTAGQVPVFSLDYRPNLRQLPHLTSAVLEAAASIGPVASFAPALSEAGLPS
jgi:hypothetical protein